MAKSETQNYRGSKIVTVRIPEDMLTEITSVLHRQEKHRHDGPMSVGEYIKYCVAEVLGKRARGKLSRDRRKAFRLKRVENGAAE